MYTPSVNAEHDINTIHKFMRDNPLCALVTQSPSGLVATHLPMVIHESSSGLGTLRGHVARANPQWKDLSAGQEALAIFTGPEHYISASWYPDKQIHGREVPTWNYVAVHAYGRIEVIEEAEWLLAHLHELTDRSETIAEVPWRVGDAPPDFIHKLTKGIVGFEMDISRFDGKWKISQTRNERDATGVMDGLHRLSTPKSGLMEDLVRARRTSQKPGLPS